MSTVFSKNKEKRSRSSSNEANNSFVKNVTSRVSGLLPATITKWFSSPSSSNANGSTPAADATDSSTEDEAPESPIMTQPPPKRMRYSSPGKYNHFTPTDANCVPTNIETNIEQITPYPTIQSPPGRSTFRRETNYVSTPIRAPNEETVIERSERDSTMFKSQHSVSNVGPSIATKRKSLFDNSTNREASMRALRTTANNTVVDPKAPCFKPSLLGSPFYPGRTMYGGASMYINQPNIKQRKVALVNESKNSDNTATMSHSARRVMDLLENYSSPLMEAKRISQFVKNIRNDTPRNDTLDGTTISGSPYANKVLSYKTQELHVPNIATILRLKQRSRLMDTTNAARQIIASHSSTMPDYQIQPYPSSNTQKETEKDTGSKLTTKVKTRVTRQNRGETIESEDQITPINLPTAVLQIDKDNLPKFTFGNNTQSTTSSTALTPIPKPTFTSTTVTLPVPAPPTSVKKGDATISKPTTVFSNDSYKFSSPVRISSESQIDSTLPKFTFGSPERGIDKPKTNKKKDDDTSIVVGTAKDTPKDTEKLSVPKSKDWQCPDCWVNNKMDVKACVCCGAKQPNKESANASKCTVCKLADRQSNSEKCINCENVKLNNNTNLPVLKPMETSKWKCEDCWVSNDQNVDNCLCCGAKNKNPKSSAPEQVQKSPITPITSIVNEWKCEECWIKNKVSVNKCAACGGARPNSKPANVPVVPSNDSGPSMFKLPDNNLNNLVKSQNDKWECPICLVRNENNRTKCVCCESDKPGLVKESDKKSFNFGMATNTSFKFGIDPKPQESSSVKLPETQPSESQFAKPEESETNNNVLPKTPSFTFGIPAKKADDQIDAAKENKITETPKIGGFTFGIPKVQSKTEAPSVSAPPPVFGSVTKLTDSVAEKAKEENEKPQEVPKVDFKFTSPKDSPKPLTSLFGAPLNSHDNKDKIQSAPSPLLNQLVSPEKKEPSGSTIMLQPSVTSSEPAKPKSTFTFTGLGNTPNLFAAPASTVSSFAMQSPATTTAATVSLFQKPEATNAPALSLFQKPNPATTSTISLFQKSETTTTAAPPSLAATAPIFSFGSNNAQSAPPPFGGNGIQNAPPPAFGGNAQSAAPAQTEKPKFNFTFGSNTTNALFNNTFGASSDNNPNANKFGITSNNLGGNGISSVNPLAAGNGLAPSKLGGEMNTNPLNQGNEMAAAPTLFGAPAQKENLWSSTNNNSSNLFVTSAPTNPMQKPAAFTFGAATPFNATSAPPAFGANPAPAQNMFGMNQTPSAQPSLFSSPVQTQSAPSMFGNPQPASTPAPAMNLFGSPSVGAAPTFGAPNTSIPSFEAPSLNPAPAPAFNFGAPQPTGVFGFGQHPQQQPQMAQAGVYSFGATPGGPQVQFNMGSAPNTGVRRVRKAVRKNPKR